MQGPGRIPTLPPAARLAVALLLLCAATAAPLPAAAANELGLTLVWSRLADVHGEAGSVETAQFSPDGSRIVSGSKFDNALIVWRTSDGTELWRRTLPHEIEKAAWTRDGRHIVVGGEDRVLRLIRAADGQLLQQVQHDNGIDSVEVSKGGRFVASGQERVVLKDGSRQGPVRIFALPGLRLVQRLDHGATVNEMDWSPDDRLLATAGDNARVKLWRTSDWTLVQTLERQGASSDPQGRIGFVTTRFSPDGRLLAVSGFGGDIHVFQVDGGALLRRFKWGGGKTETLAWTPDGRFLAAAGNHSAIEFYRLADIADARIANEALRPVLAVPVPDHLEFMQFNRAGTLLTTAHQDGVVRLWVFVGDDPELNTQRHNELRRMQDEAMRPLSRRQP